MYRIMITSQAIWINNQVRCYSWSIHPYEYSLHHSHFTVIYGNILTNNSKLIIITLSALKCAAAYTLLQLFLVNLQSKPSFFWHRKHTDDLIGELLDKFMFAHCWTHLIIWYNNIINLYWCSANIPILIYKIHGIRNTSEEYIRGRNWSVINLFSKWGKRKWCSILTDQQHLLCCSFIGLSITTYCWCN